MGWVPVALLDELDFIPADHPDRAKLEKMAVDLLKSLLAFQSEDGRWYQVVNRGDDPANWLEEFLQLPVCCRPVQSDPQRSAGCILSGICPQGL